MTQKRPQGDSPETNPESQKSKGEEQLMSKRRALIVGVNDYQGTWNDLQSCVKDAECFKDFLNHKLGFSDIKILTDKQATLSSVVSALDWLTEGVTAQDRVVFYYSGHGTTRPDGNVMREFLNLYDDLLQDEELAKRTQKLPEGVFTAIIDCSFSGGIEKRRYESIVHGIGIGEAHFSSQAPNLTVERAKIKSFVSDPQNLRHIEEAEDRATFYKPFAETARLTASGFRHLPSRVSDELHDGVFLNGTLLISCLENETAVACTTKTNGLSAFTFALLKVFERFGVSVPMDELTRSIALELRALGLRQTPRLKVRPEGLLMRSLMNLDHTFTFGSNTERVDRARLTESIVTGVLHRLSNPITQQTEINVQTNPSQAWRENMFTQFDQSVVANIVSSILPTVIDAAQREQIRRSYMQPSYVNQQGQPWTTGLTQHAPYQQTMGWTQQVPFNAPQTMMGYAPQYAQTLPGFGQQTQGLFPQVGMQQQPFGLHQQSFGLHQQSPMNHMQELCSTESCERVAQQVLQNFPVEYRQSLYPMVQNILPLVKETIAREWMRQFPISQQIGFQPRDRHALETIVASVLTSVFQVIVRGEHLRGLGVSGQIGQLGQHNQLGQFGQFGQAGQYGQYGQLGQPSQFGHVGGQFNQLGQYGQLGQLGQFGLGQFGHGQFGQVGQVEPQIVSQTIATVLPVILEVVERERVRLNQQGQTFNPEVIRVISQEVISRVQPLVPHAPLFAIVPTVIEAIVRQQCALSGQQLHAQTTSLPGTQQLRNPALV